MKSTYYSFAKPESESRLQVHLLNWSKYFAIVILVIVILVLIGWQWDIAFFKRPIRHLTSMSPLTAAAFLLAAASFLALSSRNSLAMEQAGRKTQPAGDPGKNQPAGPSGNTGFWRYWFC